MSSKVTVIVGRETQVRSFLYLPRSVGADVFVLACVSGPAGSMDVEDDQRKLAAPFGLGLSDSFGLRFGAKLPT
jgi:hypothetical protein